jgi:serine/threonine-protein kinase
MAPEQIKSEPLDGRTDQFAWAVTGYELLTGQPVWKGNSFAILARILTEKPIPLRTLAPGVPEGVAAVIERAMSKSPAERFPVMEAIVEALAPFAATPEDPEMLGPLEPEPPRRDEQATLAVDEGDEVQALRTTSVRGSNTR